MKTMGMTRKEVPELRIIEGDLWERVQVLKQRYGAMDRGSSRVLLSEKGT
jgi:hypothetical protein